MYPVKPFEMPYPDLRKSKLLVRCQGIATGLGAWWTSHQKMPYQIFPSNIKLFECLRWICMMLHVFLKILENMYIIYIIYYIKICNRVQMFPPILCSKCYWVYKGYKEILFMRDDLTVLRMFGKNGAKARCLLSLSSQMLCSQFEQKVLWVVEILVDRRELIMTLPLLIVRAMVRDVGWKGAKELWDYGHLFSSKNSYDMGSWSI